MIYGKYTNNCRVVKNQHGNILSKDSDMVKRWTEHFRSVLSIRDPYQPPDIEIDNKNVRKLDIGVEEINCS